MFSKPEFQQHSTVDKRGRKVANRKNQENMRKYYKLKDEVCCSILCWCSCCFHPQSPATQACRWARSHRLKGTPTQSTVVFADLHCYFAAVMVLKVVPVNRSCLTKTPLKPRNSDHQSLRQP